MRNFLIFITFVLIAAGIWNDLTNGSLPHTAEIQKAETEAKAESYDRASAGVPYKEIEVETGDTVLSILTSLHSGRLPANIETAIADFQKLNNGTSPDTIQPGERYKFPLYEANE